MNTNDLNTALYEKMAAEQDKYRGCRTKQLVRSLFLVQKNTAGL